MSQKGLLEVEPEFCTSMIVSEDHKGSGCLSQKAKGMNRLLGGAEAEDFGVGGGHEEPTPALG